jgi:hypothetical protein
MKTFTSNVDGQVCGQRGTAQAFEETDEDSVARRVIFDAVEQ